MDETYLGSFATSELLFFHAAKEMGRQVVDEESELNTTSLKESK
jgi:hypothetical protein